MLSRALPIYRISTMLTFLLVCVVFSAPVQAEDRSVYAVHTFAAEEDIERSYTLFWSPSGIEGVAPNAIIRTSSQGSVIVVGHFKLIEPLEDLRAVLVVIDKKGNLSAVTQQVQVPGAENLSSYNVGELRDRIVETRRALGTLEKNRDRQEASLERLQQDADTIANIGRIVDAEDELGEVTSDEGRLQKTIALARDQLTGLKNLPLPTNFSRRESELSAFLADFGRISRDSQAEVFQKLEAAERDMQDKAALIEATKDDHIDLLQKELTALRKEREALERSRQVIVQDPTPQDVAEGEISRESEDE